MKLFLSLYRRAMVWALHRYADRLGWASVAGREVGPDTVRNLEHHPGGETNYVLATVTRFVSDLQPLHQPAAPAGLHE